MNRLEKALNYHNTLAKRTPRWTRTRDALETALNEARTAVRDCEGPSTFIQEKLASIARMVSERQKKSPARKKA